MSIIVLAGGHLIKKKGLFKTTFYSTTLALPMLET